MGCGERRARASAILGLYNLAGTGTTIRNRQLKRAETVAIAQAWKRPEFHDVDGFEARVQGLEDIRFISVEVRNRPQPNRFALEGEKSGKIYGYCTGKYEIFQNRQAFQGLVDVLREGNIPVRGSIVEPTLGEFRAVLVIGNPIKGPDSDYKFVIQAINSYNGAVSWQGLSAWIRAICENGMVDMKGICARTAPHRHVMKPEERHGIWAQFIQDATAPVDGLFAVINRAQAQQVRNLEALYRGAGFGSTTTKQVIESFDKLVPESVGRVLTLWDAYNGLTKYGSNRTKGNFATNMDLLSRASWMLESPTEELEIRGLEALKVVSSP